MSLLFVCMLQKFRRHTFGVYSAGHEIMASIPEHTNNLGCQCLVQKFDYSFTICAVSFGDSTILDVLSGAIAQRFDISEKWFICHESHSLYLNLGEPGSKPSFRCIPTDDQKFISVNPRLTCPAPSRLLARSHRLLPRPAPARRVS